MEKDKKTFTLKSRQQGETAKRKTNMTLMESMKDHLEKAKFCLSRLAATTIPHDIGFEILGTINDLGMILFPQIELKPIIKDKDMMDAAVSARNLPDELKPEALERSVLRSMEGNDPIEPVYPEKYLHWIIKKGKDYRILHNFENGHWTLFNNVYTPEELADIIQAGNVELLPPPWERQVFTIPPGTDITELEKKFEGILSGPMKLERTVKSNLNLAGGKK
jgi:hypothetical protein